MFQLKIKHMLKFLTVKDIENMHLLKFFCVYEKSTQNFLVNFGDI